MRLEMQRFLTLFNYASTNSNAKKKITKMKRMTAVLTNFMLQYPSIKQLS